MDIEPIPSEPEVPAKGNVAVKWSGIITTGIAFLAAVRFALADDGISLQEWVQIGETTLIGAAAGFGISYASPAKR